MAVLRGHTDRLSSISIGAFDGTLLAVTGSCVTTVRTWDFTTAQQRDVLQSRTRAVESVQLSFSDTKA